MKQVSLSIRPARTVFTTNTHYSCETVRFASRMPPHFPRTPKCAPAAVKLCYNTRNAAERFSARQEMNNGV
jgi:hypothetical protein